MKERELSSVIRGFVEVAKNPPTINEIFKLVVAAHPDAGVKVQQVRNACFNMERADILTKIGKPNFVQRFKLGRHLKPSGAAPTSDPETLAKRRARRTRLERERTQANGRLSWAEWRAQCAIKREAKKNAKPESARAAAARRKAEAAAAAASAREAKRQAAADKRMQVEKDKKARQARQVEQQTRRDQLKAKREAPALAVMAKRAAARPAKEVREPRPVPAVSTEEFLANGGRLEILAPGQVSKPLKHIGHRALNQASWANRGEK